MTRGNACGVYNECGSLAVCTDTNAGSIIGKYVGCTFLTLKISNKIKLEE